MRLLFRTSGLALYIFFFCFTISNSQTLTKIGQAEVGMQPTSIHWDSVRQEYHVFCQGVDSDFNGICDTSKGNVPASWWVIKYDGTKFTSTKVLEFKTRYPLFPPAKPLLVYDTDSKKDKFLICIETTNSGTPNFTTIDEGKVVSYNANDYSVIDTSFINLRVTSLYKANLGIVYSHTPQPDANGVITLYDPINKVDIQSFDSHGKNITQFTVNPTPNSNLIYVLNNGSFDKSLSNLVIGKFNNLTDIQVLDTFNVGIVANAIDTKKNKICVASNGGFSTAQDVFFIDAESHAIMSDYNVMCPAGNGPRDVVYLSESIVAVSTYNNQIILIDEKNGILETVTTSSNCEGLNFNNGLLAVCDDLNSDYTSNKVVEFFKFNIVKSVEENNELSKISLFPNPSTNTIKINSNYNINSVELIDLFGDILLNKNYNASNFLSIDLRNLNLSTGQYFVRITSDKGIENKVISYIK